MAHVPVLVAEVLGHLAVDPSGTYLDATVGEGGHARALLEAHPRARLIGLDRDEGSIQAAGKALAGFGERVTLVHASFAAMADVAAKNGAAGRISGVLLDLGVASWQIDAPERGMSYRGDGALDLRFDRGSGRSTAEWFAGVDVRELARVLRDYGEVSRAGALAAVLDEERRRRPIRTTLDLVAAMERRLGSVSPGLKSRVLQALRIESNDELGEISRGLEAAARTLRPGGVLAVIAYHSLEDRIVKRALRPAPAPRRLPVSADPGVWVEVTRKPIRPSADEVRRNPRARSARLRVARRRDA